MDATELYKAFASIQQKDPNVTQARKNGFGSGLRYQGKVFAMPARGRLAIKLPEARIQELERVGRVRPYIHSAGKPAKGWCVVEQDTLDEWLDLGEEARNIASSNHN